MENREVTGNQKTEEQKRAAMRIFEALSGVDEAYLEACEADAGAEGTARKKKEQGQSVAWRMTRVARRYGVLAAAVLCVALLGAGYYFRQEKNVKDSVSNRESYAGGSAKSDDGANYVAKEATVEAAEDAWEGADDLEAAAGMKNVGDDTAGQANGYVEPPASRNKNDATVQGDPVAEQMTDLTLEEARQIAVAGAYLPEVWPSSGRMESITGTDTAGSERVSMTWTYGNGWDSFFLTVRNLGKAVPQEIQEAIADVSRPETYDVRLYEIPYADSVPEEYLDTFLDPVFRREDFGKACVEARIKAYAGDSGDTGTPRGNFRVLYQSEEGDYVLVYFNGRGSVEEIWSMINSVNYFVQYEAWMKPEMP